MIDLSRYFTSPIFYVTVETIGRESIIIGSMITHLLRTVLTDVKQAHHFNTLGFVLLPDHVHLLIYPDTHVTLDAIVQRLASQFEHEYAQLMGQPKAEPIWQRSYPARRMRDEADLARHLDWVHYNPVYHQHVKKPEEWPYSSYQVWLERGLYTAEWGGSLPESIVGKHWG